MLRTKVSFFVVLNETVILHLKFKLCTAKEKVNLKFTLSEVLNHEQKHQRMKSVESVK